MSSNLLLALMSSIMIIIRSERDVFKEIVGGYSTHPFNYPFIVTIQVNGYHFCGGSLLRIEHPAMVLTAAHCASSSISTIIRLYADDADAPPSNTNEYIDTTILKTEIHPEYNDFTLDNDIMIIWLKENIEWDGRLDTVTIEPYTGSECCQSGDALQVIGYGNDCYMCQNTPTLEYADVSYIDRDHCSYLYHNQITNNMNCAGIYPEGGSDACQGDSGGPLIRYGTNKQIGIVSWGMGCASSYPGVYTDIGPFYHWIQQQINSDVENTEKELVIQGKTSLFIYDNYYILVMVVSVAVFITILICCYCNNSYPKEMYLPLSPN